jgi:glyoxylase-like metal-dependent hydrolase (beta-lactamase superfamily II)
MLQIECFTFNAFQENTYLLINENKECWVVDPGMYENDELSYFTTYISTHGLKPQSIINTHTHLDHIFGVNGLKNEYDIPFGIHTTDLPVLNGAAGAAMLFGFNFRNIPKVDFYIEANTPLSLGTDILDVRYTPGHSPGSISFYYAADNWVIGGDVLFNGSIGRTDLPGGNFDTLIKSIKTELFTLPDNTLVYSGHGPTTNIGQEKKHNPFLQN